MRRTAVNRRRLCRSALACAAACLALGLTRGRAAEVGPDAKDVKECLDKGVAALRATQAADGSWSAQATGPGATALVVAALLRNGVPADDPMVSKGLAYLEKSIKKDGGIYDKVLANYTTSVAVMALKEANKGGKYDAVIKNATAFLKGIQQGGDDVKTGGTGYDAKSRPDLSNTQFFVEALLAAGVPRDDPAIQNALKFISRCQNLPGEGANDQPFAKKAADADKGGLTYTPLDPDDSPHKTADGGLRSLGAMTYGGLKSFLYAGVGKDDKRVKACIAWVRRHYTLDENPGLKQAGLYYYYHTFAKALDAWGEDLFEDGKGQKHDWRKELFAALKKRQGQGGGWVNQGDERFGEADPNIATAFALLSLSYVKPHAK
jgi:squalene-hopene/tetraprenyl-beta-curcumene cyclase